MRALLVLLATSRLASADILWSAPAGCPDRAAVHARIEQRFGGLLHVHGIDVAVVRRGAAFVATIDTRGLTVVNQIRTLTAATCDELADAVAVIVARLASEEPPMRRRAEPRPIEVRVESPGAPRTWGAGLQMLALSGIGIMPRVGVGGEVAAIARRKRLFAQLGYARWSTSSAYLMDDGAATSVDLQLAVVTVRAGWSPPEMPLRAWVGGEVGSIGITGDDAVPWRAITSGFGVGWPMTRYARLFGTFEVAVPTSRGHEGLGAAVDVHSASALSARCALGLEVGLP